MSGCLVIANLVNSIPLFLFYSIILLICYVTLILVNNKREVNKNGK